MLGLATRADVRGVLLGTRLGTQKAAVDRREGNELGNSVIRLCHAGGRERGRHAHREQRDDGDYQLAAHVGHLRASGASRARWRGGRGRVGTEAPLLTGSTPGKLPRTCVRSVRRVTLRLPLVAFAASSRA